MDKQLVLLGSYRDESDREYFVRCYKRLHAKQLEKIAIPWSFGIANDKIDLVRKGLPIDLIISKRAEIYFVANCVDVFIGRTVPESWMPYVMDEDLSYEAASWYLVSDMVSYEKPLPIKGLFDWYTDKRAVALPKGWRYAYWR